MLAVSGPITSAQLASEESGKEKSQHETARARGILESMKMFERMSEDLGICPDVVSLVNVLLACASVGAWSQGK